MGLWFYQDMFLKDAGKKLINAQEGKAKALRQWRFISDDEVVNEKDNILAYLHEAIENQKQGKAIKPQSKPAFVVPPELIGKLDNDHGLKCAFNRSTQSKQREYCEHISNAMQNRTKQKRLEKIITMVMKGGQLNDKYRK